MAVSHLRKSGGGEAMLQVTGSLAFVAAARAAYIIAKDQADPARKLMLPAKNNLGEDRIGYAFRIESVRLSSSIETSRVNWEAECVTVTADEALAGPENREERSALEEAQPISFAGSLPMARCRRSGSTKRQGMPVTRG